MSENPGEPGEDPGIEKRPPDPFVAARVPDPTRPAEPTIELSGLLGDSDREGRRRLYLNTRLDYYVEFANSDVLAVESLGPDVPPFVGLDATRVTLSRDARVEYVRTQSAASAQLEGFAVDAVPAGLTQGPDGPVTEFPTLPTDTLFTNRCTDIRTLNCTFDTCGIACTAVGCLTVGRATCRTCVNDTCFTCDTCGGQTCATCGEATCVTCRWTCSPTCHTCGQTTCVTRGVTCVTCETCETCVTCRVTQCNTCANTCFPFRCVTQVRCPTRFPPCP